MKTLTRKQINQQKKERQEIADGMIPEFSESLLGECLDVRKIGQPLKGHPGDYVLRGFIVGMAYADVDYGIRIQSIGRNKKTGRIIASDTTKFYENPEYDCLWLY